MKITDELIQSPLNYIGGKFKLLPQILPLFPDDIEQFVDLFCGGGNVGINVRANQVLFNDSDRSVFSLLRTFQTTDKAELFSEIDRIIDAYGLSRSDTNSYGFYGCQSSSGLGPFNKTRFLKLRSDFNSMSERNASYYLMLYVLVVFSFNNQIRFNSRGEFNLPVGKRDFNPRMRAKLSHFIDRLQSKRCSLSCTDFSELDPAGLTNRDFVYMDPPYLITCATYNEQGGWNEQSEARLLAYIDELHARGVRFALSNVLRSKGRENRLLIEWLNRNRNAYRAVGLNYTYSNSNYQTKDRVSGSEEVLVINY